MIIPTTTKGARSTVAVAGSIRYNVNTNQMESFDGTGWIIVGEPIITHPWESWFAWRPVKVHNRWKWLRKVYRKQIPRTYVDYDDWIRYEYGTVFDVIKDS